MNFIKELRKEKRITQKEISIALGISERQYRRLEQGKCPLSIERARYIANLLDTDLNTLLHYLVGKL